MPQRTDPNDVPPPPPPAPVVRELYMVMPEEGGVGIVDVTLNDGRQFTLVGEYRALAAAGATPVECPMRLEGEADHGRWRIAVEDLERALREAAHGDSVLVLSMDLDGLKAVNDHQGHERGRVHPGGAAGAQGAPGGQQRPHEGGHPVGGAEARAHHGHHPREREGGHAPRPATAAESGAAPGRPPGRGRRVCLA